MLKIIHAETVTTINNMERLIIYLFYYQSIRISISVKIKFITQRLALKKFMN